MDFDAVSQITLPAQWGVPDGSRVFTLPIRVELSQQPALNATLLVTDPRPSLLACGGIVGFVAQNPKNDEIYVTLRVISTRWSTGAMENQKMSVFRAGPRGRRLLATPSEPSWTILCKVRVRPVTFEPTS